MTDSKRVFVPAVQMGKSELMRGLSPTVVLVKHLDFLRRIETAEQTISRIAVPGSFYVRDGETFREVDPEECKPSGKPVEWIKDV